TAFHGMDVTSAKQWKQGQARCGGVRIERLMGGARIGPTLILEVQRPGAVRPLMPHDPFQSLLDRFLRMGCPSLATDELCSSKALPPRKRGRDRLRESWKAWHSPHRGGEIR